MYLAYIDESGDAGLKNSPTKFFVLSCVLVQDSDWLPTLNQLINLRRTLKKQHNITMRKELKAVHIAGDKGAMRPLKWSRSDRLSFFQSLFQFENTLSLRTFAIAINKTKAGTKIPDVREAAWRRALERIQRFCEVNQDNAVIFPDEGEPYFIRKLLRKMRRFNLANLHWGQSVTSFPVHKIIEDPNPRNSQESLFVQLADWNAYAAHRSKHIDKRPGTENLWDELTNIHVTEVNRVAGGPPAIVVYPK